MLRLLYFRYCLRTAVYFATLGIWAILATPWSRALALSGRCFEVDSLVTRSFSHLVGWALGLRRWTPIGPILFLSGCILVDGGATGRAVASMRKASPTLREAHVSLVVFPEGTRNNARVPSLLPWRIPHGGTGRTPDNSHRLRELLTHVPPWVFPVLLKT
ncbi:hypothetical protein K438DRAFT_2068255 [Mycena galopus ATCC 62051]|nr:hypothetical protein K438DRAFT_2068255 [Mycena galopus ATCC 62051]